VAAAAEIGRDCDEVSGQGGVVQNSTAFGFMQQASWGIVVDAAFKVGAFEEQQHGGDSGDIASK
jgi:hypothetical protein